MGGNGHGTAPWHKSLDMKNVWGRVSSVITTSEVYKWKPIHGKIGKLEMLPLDLLYLDESYQRTDTMNRALSIAKEFDWTAFGVLIVAGRSDSTYYVVDGGTRAVAARYRGISKVPCIVHEFDSVSEEAWAFFTASTNRGALSWTHKHRALVVADDDVAKGVEEMLETTGHVGKNNDHPQSVRFLAALHSAYKNSPAKTEQVWWLTSLLFKGVQPTHGIFTGLFYLSTYHPDLKGVETITDSPLGKRLLYRGITAVHSDVLEYVKQSTRGGAKEYARAIIAASNKHLRNEIISPI